MDDTQPVLTGELVAPTPDSSTLSPQQMQAVILDSGGSTRKEIAQVVGVSESSVKQWRALPAYQAELDRVRSRNAEVLSKPVRELREHIITGADAAVRTLERQLDAVDSKGNDLNGVQQKAAELLLTLAVDLIKEDTAAKAKAATGPTGPTTAITINMGDKPPEPPA